MQDDMNPDDAGQTEATGPEPAAELPRGAPRSHSHAKPCGSRWEPWPLRWGSFG